MNWKKCLGLKNDDTNYNSQLLCRYATWALLAILFVNYAYYYYRGFEFIDVISAIVVLMACLSFFACTSEYSIKRRREKWLKVYLEDYHSQEGL